MRAEQQALRRFRRLRQFNLLRQGEEVDQDVPGQFVGLLRLHIGDAVNFVQPIVADGAKAVSPSPQRRRDEMVVRQVADARPQVLNCRRLRRNLLGANVQRAAVHSDGCFFVAAPQTVLRLAKCFRDRGAAIRWDVSSLWPRKKLAVRDWQGMEISMQQLSVKRQVRISPSGGANRSIAVVADKKVAERALAAIADCSSPEGEPHFLHLAVRAVVNQGERHV